MSETPTDQTQTRTPPPETPPAPSFSNSGEGFKAMIAALPEEVRGTISGANYDSFEAMARSYQSAKSLIGADKATVLRVPTGEAAADPANWQPVYEALGVPADGQYAEWKPAEEGGKLPLSPEAVSELDKALAAKGVTQAGRDAGLQFFADQVAKAEKEVTDALNAEKAQGAVANQQLWGAKTPQMLAAAEQGLTGVDGADEFVKLMKDTQLYDHPAFVRVRASLAMMRAEDGAPLKGDGKPVASALTPAEAKAKISALQSDKAWVERYKNGGTASPEMLEFLELQKMATATGA